MIDASRPLRIAFIVPFLYHFQRGIERSCTQLANVLARQGHQVTIMAWGQRVSQTDFALHPTVRVVCVPYFRYYRARWAIAFYIIALLRGRFDVVNVYFAGYGEAEALVFARRLRRFQVNFVAGYPIAEVPFRFAEFRRFGFDRLLDHVVVKSSPMVPDIARFFGREVEVITNGVDADYFRPGAAGGENLRRQLGLAKDDKVLLTVSALEKRKGVQHVIRHLPAALATQPHLHYVVVGDGPYRRDLEALAKELGVTHHLHFVGAATNVLPFYELADVFALLSQGDAFPNTLLEAWAMGLPAIVSKHSPYPDIVPPEAGTCVDETDPSEVVAELNRLFDDPGERQRQGAWARNFVATHKTWEQICAQYLELFRRSSHQV